MEVGGEENESIVHWVEETQKKYPKLLFIDSIHNLTDFLRRSYSYEVGEMAIANCNLQSILSIPHSFLLQKGECLKEALIQHRTFYCFLFIRHVSTYSCKTTVDGWQFGIAHHRHLH